MPTTKTRINLSLSDSTRLSLIKLARRDRVPAATKATRLLETALELEEDEVWNALAEQRDAKNARYFSHTRAWQ